MSRGLPGGARVTLFNTGTLLRRAMQRHATSVLLWVQGVYQACYGDQILALLLWITAAVLISCTVVVIVAVVLWCCFVGGVATSVAFRSYWLADIPQNQVLPVSLEVAPVDVPARSWQDDTRLPRDIGIASDLAMRLSSQIPATKQSKTVSTTRTTTMTQSRKEGDAEKGSTTPDDSCAETVDCNKPLSEPRDRRKSKEFVVVDEQRHHHPQADVHAELVRDVARVALTLSERRIGATLATGVVRIRDVVRAADVSQIEWYQGDTPLFVTTRKNQPLFNAPGSYSAVLQLVVREEEAHRAVSLSVHASMLGTTCGIGSLCSDASLFPVFQREHGTSVVMCNSILLPWVLQVAQRVSEFVFYIPLRLFAVAKRLLEEESGPFPPVDSDAKEVALLVPLYSGFHPSVALQKQLALLNITVYQRCDATGGVPKRNGAVSGTTDVQFTCGSHVHLVRASVAFSVQLEGFTYFLTEYPLLSSALLTCFFSTSFAMMCGCVVIGLVAGSAYLALVFRN